MPKPQLDTTDLAEIVEWMNDEGKDLSGQVAQILAGSKILTEWDL